MVITEHILHGSYTDLQGYAESKKISVKEVLKRIDEGSVMAARFGSEWVIKMDKR